MSKVDSNLLLSVFFTLVLVIGSLVSTKFSNAVPSWFIVIAVIVSAGTILAVLSSSYIKLR